MIVKIQHRRGDFADFDPTQLLPSEFAIIQADDPNTSDGTAIYIGISSGVIKRLATADEIVDLVNSLVNNALDSKQDALVFDIAPTAGSTNVLSSGTIYSVLDALTLAWSKITNKPSINPGTGTNSTKENTASTASGSASHAEGASTTASGNRSHAEGYYATASGISSHAEGHYTTAAGIAAHAEGSNCKANGDSSHAEGNATVANRYAQHVFGTFNVPEPAGTDPSAKGNYVEIVGNGTSSNAKSNARTLDWSGNEVLSGKLTVGAAPTANMDVTTKKYVDDLGDSKQSTITISGTGLII